MQVRSLRLRNACRSRSLVATNKARATALHTVACEKLRFEAYTLYLEMLKITGILSSDPGKNHLMADKAP